MNQKTYLETEKFAHEGITKALIESLRLTLNGGERQKFDGLLPIISSLTATQASQSLAEGHSSIAVHVAHLEYSFDFVYRVFNGEAVIWQDIDWHKGDFNDLEWTALRERLEQNYKTLLEFAAQKPFWRAEGLQAFIDNIAHTAYHAGAIRQMIKRL